MATSDILSRSSEGGEVGLKVSVIFPMMIEKVGINAPPTTAPNSPIRR